MHKIEQALQVFLETIETKDVKDYDKIIEEFGEDCKAAIRECLLSKRSEEPFKLRMSNIGKPLRQLLLEKKYGRSPMDAQLRLRMTYGYIWESFTLFLLKAAGIPLEINKKVKLDIAYDNKKNHTLFGKLDIKIDGEIYDIKSASPWSFDNKFTSFDNMEHDDPFGYIGQAFGYSLADKSYFGGWLVIDKSNGRMKIVPVPKEKYRELARKYLDDFKLKVKTALYSGDSPELPPCPGVVKETFNKAETGNLILNKSCEFCDHKYNCHPGLIYKECGSSKAKTKTWKYYVKLLTPNDDN